MLWNDPSAIGSPITSLTASILFPVDERFVTRYSHDPWSFVAECIRFPSGKGPYPYQREILSHFVGWGRVAVRGPHGLGKTAMAAWLTLWGVLTATDVKVVTTARSWRQLTKFLWPEIHIWASRLRWDVIGRPPLVPDRELLQQSITLGAKQQAFAAATSDPSQIEGAHARRILYIFDEARDIPAAIWDAAEGAFTGEGEDTPDEAFAFAISTPRAPIGRFYDIHSGKLGYRDWHPVHVTLEQVLAAGAVSQGWVENRALQWGETSPMFVNRVLGDFAASSEDAVIPLAWVELAHDRWHQRHDEDDFGAFQKTGVDVARYGEDLTVIARLHEHGIRDLLVSSKEDTMQTVRRVRLAVEQDQHILNVVDVIGLGAGVVDRLRELQYDVFAFNGAAKATVTDKSGELVFANARAAAYWGLRERLDPEFGDDIALPPDPDLTRELTSIRWKETSGGRILMQSKEDLKTELGTSPNKADAVVMAYYAGAQRGIYFA